MDYIGFSIYSRHLLGDAKILKDYNIDGDDPEAVFPALFKDIEEMMNAMQSKKKIGGVIHLCNMTSLFNNDFIIDPWISFMNEFKERFPFKLGLHINFDHSNLPLAPGFINTFKETMKLCSRLNIDAIVLHAPLIETDNTDEDWANLMIQEEILNALRDCNASLCWENAQDPSARYRSIEALVNWRKIMIKKLEETNNNDLRDRFQFCFDTGHFLLSLQRDGINEKELTTFLPEFAKHVKVFHIQCNDGTSDQHLIPFMDLNNVDLEFAVNKSKFLDNSKLIVEMLKTCKKNAEVKNRHVHLEVDSPSPIPEMIKFYKIYNDEIGFK
ncbi:MAG: TIM barrel protein [Promethearchaeota archaeon]